MKKIFKAIKLALLIYAQITAASFAAESANTAFLGIINRNNINVRSDSNTTSSVICQIGKNTAVEVVNEKYDWYKIKLPKHAPCYVKKELVDLIDNKTAKVSRENVNIRLSPSDSSQIIGKIDTNEVIAILSDDGLWYKIKATDNTFGWVHKKFIAKSLVESPSASMLSVPFSAANPLNETIILEGIIEPYGKVIKRVATHKLITKDYDIYLLKGVPGNLNALTYHKVRITGKAIPPARQKYPVIEIVKMEALD